MPDLYHWEWAEYFACALVAISCAGEYIAEFTNWLSDGDKERKARLSKKSTLLLIASLAFEIICLYKTNSISGLLIGSLSEKAEAADAKAQSAFNKSDLAETKANGAMEESTNAESLAQGAQTKLEKERTTRLQLQRSVLHRMIRQTGQGDKTNFDGLKPFKGTLVVFEYWPDGELGMFSGTLASFVINSGWFMLDKWWNIPANQRLPDGVTIESYTGPHGETDSSSAAADALAEFLKNNGH